jgi:hypothetical protein
MNFVPFDQERRLHQRREGLRMTGKDAHGIAADPEEDRMAQRYHSTQPQRDVEPDPRHGKDRNLGRQRDGEGLAREMRPDRDAQQQGHDGGVDVSLADHRHAFP